MEHAHHEHAPAGTLRIAFALTVIILVMEAVIGYLANSLALLSDAGHILTDVVALALAWFAAVVANRPPDQRNTFGYRRAGIVAALVNALVLIAIAIAILVEATVRLQHPESVQGALIIPAAGVALLINGYIALALHNHEASLNVRAALLHVIGDMAASVGVILAGIVILLWHVTAADPLISALIALLIAVGAWRIARETLVVLMEGTPRGVDLAVVRAAMLEVPGVEDVHDLHVWSLADGFRLLTAHIATPNQSLADTANLLADVKLLLRRRFHIEHATIEAECNDCRIPPRRLIRFE
jgi:cobalt-zinc-cadmium efflux system protein